MRTHQTNHIGSNEQIRTVMIKKLPGKPGMSKTWATLGICGFLVLGLSSVAGAAEAVGGDENGQISLLDLPAADPSNIPGSACVVSSGNNESVHPGNTLIIEQGGEVVSSGEIENAPNDGFDFPFTTDGSAVRVYIQLAPTNQITSADVVVVCVPPEPTTTTTVPEETTTTVPEETTTTVPEETTTTVPEETTTTVPEETTTTVPEETTTTVPEETTTTVPEETTTTTINQNCPPDGLACTGPSQDTQLALGFGALFVVLGMISLVAVELFRP